MSVYIPPDGGPVQVSMTDLTTGERRQLRRGTRRSRLAPATTLPCGCTATITCPQHEQAAGSSYAYRIARRGTRVR